ncbi:hypothetical protein [Microbaculum marinisediminis]|uniref:Uncharacterized protein n=1 Tax=Microbaculum marinisediminis TaxID=2931392 RepID=A0AAW5QVY2_9HYPH|nr:hypothetical protein [Microbaculum sp. A6E488]MCT8970543.1 hypothetical protein [Microbaculum sp. A6E488]
MATENTPIKTAQDATKAPPDNPGAAKPAGTPKPEQKAGTKSAQANQNGSPRK